ncbi:MAG: hypothetical protein RSD10_04850 [Anaerovoracaceae bacterium]
MAILQEIVLTIAASCTCITASVMFISMLIEDKKRTKYEEERTEIERKNFEERMKNIR